MPEDFDPAVYFTPEEYARIRQPVLEREAARARSAAKRAAARNETLDTLAKLQALAEEATREAEENRNHLTALQSQGEAP